MLVCIASLVFFAVDSAGLRESPIPLRIVHSSSSSLRIQCDTLFGVVGRFRLAFEAKVMRNVEIAMPPGCPRRTDIPRKELWA